ncbi:MAG: nitroreductase [Firmicutes bacterium]|nr:nitroreductase [Bacillota bacterium]
MDILDAIKSRRSIRSFLPEPVPRGVIREILDAAIWAPSALNTQPWEFTVVGGEVLAGIKQGNIEKLLSGAVIHSPRTAYEGIYRQRRIELAKDLFQLMDIKREDGEKRAAWLQRGYRFFDAPAAIIISVDKSLEGTWSLFDIGTVSQAICLAALEYGLGTCIEDQGVQFPEVIRKHTGLPENKEIVIGIAIGYPDPMFPANTLISRREPLDGITAWLGF